MIKLLVALLGGISIVPALAQQQQNKQVVVNTCSETTYNCTYDENGNKTGGTIDTKSGTNESCIDAPSGVCTPFPDCDYGPTTSVPCVQ